MTTRRRAPVAPAKRRRRRGMITRGDRPYFVAVLVLLGLLGAMTVGPLQSFTAAAERVDDLTASRDQLQTEVDRLEAERQRLQDPEELELLAREELGMVRPGEIPYVVVSPEPAFDAQHPAELAPPGSDVPWYERLWNRIAAAVGG